MERSVSVSPATAHPGAAVTIKNTVANAGGRKSPASRNTATGTFSDNSTQDITTSVTWSSATTSVATISSRGLATALTTGTTTIRASESAANVSGSTVLTVN